MSLFRPHETFQLARGGPLVATVGDKVDHRIMRRADAYGPPPYTGTDDGESRGLAGPFMCAMLSNQFEFLMSQWVNGATLAGGKAFPGNDPLLGNVGEVPNVANQTEFTYWRNGKAVQVANLSRFVTTKGGYIASFPALPR